MNGCLQEFINRSIQEIGVYEYDEMPGTLGEIFEDCSGVIPSVVDQMIEMMQKWVYHGKILRWSLNEYSQDDQIRLSHQKWDNKVLEEAITHMSSINNTLQSMIDGGAEVEFWKEPSDTEMFKISVIYFPILNQLECESNYVVKNTSVFFKPEGLKMRSIFDTMDLRSDEENVRFEKDVSREEIKDILMELLRKDAVIVVDDCCDKLNF
jgi:hypothetical protein